MSPPHFIFSGTLAECGLLKGTNKLPFGRLLLPLLPSLPSRHGDRPSSALIGLRRPAPPPPRPHSPSLASLLLGMDATDSGEEARSARHDLDMLLQHHRAAVTAFGLSLQKSSAHQPTPKHHTIESILGLRSEAVDGVQHGPGTESSGE